MPNSDRTLTCRQCSAQFVFTAGEQDFYAARGLVNDPTRCSRCRSALKLNGSTEPPMSESYVHYGPFASFGGRTPRQMHPATCTQCNQMTEVPFAPRNDRPVLCSECFSMSKRGEEQAQPHTRRN